MSDLLRPLDGSIVLIGATGTGKTSIGRELATMLCWQFVELDDLRKAWYPEFGLDDDAERLAVERGGIAELVALWKPYEILSVERVMAEHPCRTVIAFGGGQSVYVDPEQIARAQKALSVASRVILLHPRDTGRQSFDVLIDRIRTDERTPAGQDVDGFLTEFAPILEMQLQAESQGQLATELIVTGESSPEEIARHIATTMDATLD